ncbi:hypothetical protein ISS85_00450 [Candidatus Microgenomates bacterium]|nr:hypothetical protein [Candidatus Microgenomates bacterium]
MKEKIKNITQSTKSFFVEKVDLKKVFVKNFIAGIAWGIGATIGLSLIFAIITSILKGLGGLPIVGTFFADLIEVTNKALELRRVR